MQKIKLILFSLLIISTFETSYSYALSGDTYLDKKDQTLYIEEMLAINFETSYEFSEYKMTASTKGINPNIDSNQKISASTKTNNLVLNVGMEMDIAPRWFIGAKGRTNISTGSDSQTFTAARSGSLSYDRYDISLLMGRRFYFVPTNYDNLLQFKTYAGLKYSTTKTTLSEVSFAGQTVTSKAKAPDNITDKSQSLNAVLGFSLSRKFEKNNFIEIYTEFGLPLENETKSSFNDNFMDDSDGGSAFETGVKAIWRYTPQSFFSFGVYYGMITFDGGKLTEINYVKNETDTTTYYQWGENETTYWGIKGSYILKF